MNSFTYQELRQTHRDRTRIRLLSRPNLDRMIALIATLPFLWLAFYRWHHMKLGLPLFSFTSGVLILFLTMIFRRPPTRVTLNPRYWLLAFLATYWPVVTVSLIQRGVPVAPQWACEVVGLCSLAVTIWARVSLERNIGFVLAQRQIVTTGAYSYMRHPIDTGLFLGYLALGLRVFSLRNVSILGLGRCGSS